MEKLRKLKLIMSLAALILFSAASCKNLKPDPHISKRYTVSDFSSLNLELIGEVIYEQADSFYLNASGSSTLIESLKVSDSKEVLSIILENKHKYTSRKKKLVIRVGSPDLQSINLKVVGTFQLKNHFESDELDINNKGVGKIIIDDCHVGTFNLTSKSVGSMEARGTSNEAFIHSEGVGNIDCSEFRSKITKVVSKGTGNLSVYAEESIDISLKGVGNIAYYGNPAEVKTDISGIGKITRMDP